MEEPQLLHKSVPRTETELIDVLLIIQSMFKELRPCSVLGAGVYLGLKGVKST